MIIIISVTNKDPKTYKEESHSPSLLLLAFFVMVNLKRTIVFLSLYIVRILRQLLKTETDCCKALFLGFPESSSKTRKLVLLLFLQERWDRKRGGRRRNRVTRAGEIYGDDLHSFKTSDLLLHSLSFRSDSLSRRYDQIDHPQTMSFLIVFIGAAAITKRAK